MSKKFTVLAVMLSLMVVGAVQAQEAEYVGNSQCKMCHNKEADGKVWTVWSSSAHAKAYELLGTPESKAVAEKAGVTGSPQEAPECLSCHVTAYSKDAMPAKIKMEDGVQCESCHGPASLHVADGKAKMMKKDETVDISAHIKKGDEAGCRTCHNEKSPTWNPERYTLADGTKAGFDFEQAWKKIEHGKPDKAE